MKLSLSPRYLWFEIPYDTLKISPNLTDSSVILLTSTLLSIIGKVDTLNIFQHFNHDYFPCRHVYAQEHFAACNRDILPPLILFEKANSQPNRDAGQDDEQIVNVVFYEKSLAQNVEYLN